MRAGDGGAGGIQALGEVVQQGADAAEGRCRVCARGAHARCGVAHGALELLGNGLSGHAYKLLGDLRLERCCSGVCDLGGNGIDLLVYVVVHLGLGHVAVKDAGKRAREVLWNDKGGVVASRAHARERIVFAVQEGPLELVVLLKVLVDHLASVDGAHAADLGARVLDDHRHRDR